MKRVIVLTTGLSIVVASLLADVNANIELDPIIEKVVSGKRILVKANIEDKVGIDVARTYFKSADGANYSFVPMNCEGTACTSTLPAISTSTKSIDYLVLVKNKENVVYKTQTFNALTLPEDSKVPAYQIEPTDEVIQVKTELAKAPKMVEGFSDNIVLDAVEDTARYGAVAGLYSSSTTAAGGTATAATTTTGAVSGGTVAATSATVFTTTAIVGSAVAVAAVGGGVAVVANNTKNDNNSHEDTMTPAPTEAPTVAPTEAPTSAPTEAPTAAPTEAPSSTTQNFQYSVSYNDTAYSSMVCVDISGTTPLPTDDYSQYPEVTISQQPCPTTSVIGACTFSNTSYDVKIKEYFYVGIPLDTVQLQEACSQAGAVYSSN
jgi:hypothetical protein